MSYLAAVIAGLRGQAQGVQPRLAVRYETMTAGDGPVRPPGLPPQDDAPSPATAMAHRVAPTAEAHPPPLRTVTVGTAPSAPPSVATTESSPPNLRPRALPPEAPPPWEGNAPAGTMPRAQIAAPLPDPVPAPPPGDASSPPDGTIPALSAALARGADVAAATLAVPPSPARRSTRDPGASPPPTATTARVTRMPGPPAQPAPAERTAEPLPTVRVTIGRIDLRAAPAKAATRPPADSRRSDDSALVRYLNQRGRP